MLDLSDDLLFPAGIWAAVGTGDNRNGSTLRVLLFDGPLPVDDKTGLAPDLFDFIDMQCGLGLEFVAVSSASWLGRYAADDDAVDLSAYVALDAWSGIIGIQPRLIAPAVEDVAVRLGDVIARLAALEPGVLLQSDAWLGFRRNGEQRLIRGGSGA